jgi:hypothetical protein
MVEEITTGHHDWNEFSRQLPLEVGFSATPWLSILNITVFPRDFPH